LDSRLIVVSSDPFNAESPLDEQSGAITPNHLFYVRNHFPIPEISLNDWRLSVGGEVERPLSLSYGDLKALPSRTFLATLECAGNGRFGLQPRVEGEQWQYGAVSTAEWTGVSLSTVLADAGLGLSVCEILAEGSDRGKIAHRDEPISFERSLPLEKALHPDTILAYAMNGERLSAEHGFPVRLIVPGWYGVASVKWLTRIEAVRDPFAGYYQADRYVLVYGADGQSTPVPLGSMAVRSLITEPTPDARIPTGSHMVRGLAWSGRGPIVSVEVNAGGKDDWVPAQLASEPQPYAWSRWEYQWKASITGRATLQSRATDSSGATQALDPRWNVLGYANNAVQTIDVTVV
jgi:DMSO/TMAO reductase YedYZ molybdopterin-dependent catalytic subunit